MRRVVVFGNSGSGKSTLAKELCEAGNLKHLDLDILAWEATTPPQRKSLRDSKAAIELFMNSNQDWVVEGCYADLLEIALPFATEIIFLNLPVELCIENAKTRPWEPHKYNSKEAQDANLSMLIDWISQYSARDDVFSQIAHRRLFDRYPGRKTMYVSNERNT